MIIATPGITSNRIETSMANFGTVAIASGIAIAKASLQRLLNANAIGTAKGVLTEF